MKYWATINSTKSAGATCKTLCSFPFLPPLTFLLSPLSPPRDQDLSLYCIHTEFLSLAPANSPALVHTAHSKS